MSRLDTPIPKRMRGLQRDHRGYPVPFVVLRDTDGKPHFTINDQERQMRCLVERRCAICGGRLERPMWLVGGPMSAFCQNGAYIDSALHQECMEYALQVCPYLAAPNYLGRIDDATLDYEKLPKHVRGTIDPTMISTRPKPFVAVCTRQQQWWMTPDGPRLRGEKPYIAVQYWVDGTRVSEEFAKPLVETELAKADGLRFQLLLPRWL